MGLKALVLAGTTLAAMSVGFAAPAFAAAQAVPRTTVQQPMGDNGNDTDVSGLVSESPVCSALGTETVPTGDDVAKCLSGGSLIG
jgi:hypothetical protein